MRFLPFFLWFSAGIASAGELLLQPYQLTYEASYNGMPISAERQLQALPNGDYELTTTAANFFASITEKGIFSTDENGAFVHQSYQYKRNVFGKKKTEELIYDRTNMVADYTTKKKHRQVPLDKEYLNRLSYQVQLRQDLINGKELLEYQVISRGRLKTYRFEKSAQELLETDLGNIKALRVDRIRKDKSRQTALWFAPELDYLLVKLWQREEDGEEYQIVLQQGILNGQNLSHFLTTAQK